MSIVLIHGGAITAACWDPLIPHLKSKTIAPNLPGRPGSPADHADITVERWADHVTQEMDKAGVGETILAGHSMGGITMITLARLIPDRIRHLVFIAAPIPNHNGRMMDVLKPNQRAAMEVSLADGATTLGGERSPSSLEEEARETRRARNPMLVREVLGPFAEPISLEGLRNGIPMTYVKLLRDKSLTTAMMDGYVETLRELGPCEKIELDAEHLVMMTAPELLADLLNPLAV